MTKKEFQRFCKNTYVYLDGATGSNLVRAGMPSGVCPEQWILEHRQVLADLQKAYVEAGTNILYAPTFTANRIKLSEYGLADRIFEMTKELVSISREAAAGKKRVLVAGDLTMTGEQLKPLGRLDLEDLIEIYKEQILSLEAAGVDLLVVETMMSLAEARAALIAAKECTGLPVMVTMTFEPGGRTLFGTDAKTAAVVLESLGACALGVNCSAGPAHMQQLIADMAEVTMVPIIAKPNAGVPGIDREGNTCYDMTPEEFAGEMKLLAGKGATLLGGCCGTTPEYIQKLRETLEACPFQSAGDGVLRRQPGHYYLSSERKTVAFGGPKESLLIVGERINPTGKKALQSELMEGSLEKVLALAAEQEECGAQILDVNLGMSGIEEKEIMLRALEEIAGATALPLSIDSSSVEVIEAALRAYPGRALVNSVSMEKEKLEKLLPLAAKYGAMFILLPLSDKGLPENQQEKHRMIQAVYEKALDLGMGREDVVVDALVTTVGANRQAAPEALETIRFCRERGFATICGLSNISFGLPRRSFVNAAFLALAMKEGLTMAIANPSQELLAGCALATDMLLGKEGADLQYIAYTGRKNESAAEAVSVKDSHTRAESSENCPLQGSLENAVLKGNKGGIAALARQALEGGDSPEDLLNRELLPAINKVGEYFDKGIYFLPQLIASAQAMKNALEILEPLLLKEAGDQKRPTAVLATVEGDIHDIGKNLVALMLRNHGFQVIDLGKDVPKEAIILAAKEHNARIIGLSALMTTTMRKMKEVIAYAKEQGVSAKIMIGGAVVTKEYADEIGADGYAKDAAEAVRVAEKFIL